ncbi:MAG: sigma-70 family RNA polymerase sigma factor [Cytophagaceae bacterium]|nr:sigma-70 family RNA polymerase sigma factor [Gemmatimonadaceae bacterium]
MAEGRPFPDTRPSVVRDAIDVDPAARARGLDAMARAYWEPTHAYVRLRWRTDDESAKDLTQEFFAHALERELLHRYDPARAKLRTYLRLCIDSFVANAFKAGRRLKRGGAETHIDVYSVAEFLPTDGREDAEAAFEREWIRALFSGAVDALHAECLRTGKETHFGVFHRYDIEEAEAERRSTYADLAVAFDIPVTQVTNYLAWARRRLRAHVLEVLRAQCGSDAEYRDEARALLGVRG